MEQLISEMHDFFDPEVVWEGNVNSGPLDGTQSTIFPKTYALRLKNANTGEILTLDIVKGRTLADLGQRNINQFCAIGVAMKLLIMTCRYYKFF